MSAEQPFRYAFLDFETCGSRVAKAFPTVPAQLVITLTDRDFEPVSSIEVFFKFDADKYIWSEEAYGVHGFSKEFLEINGVTTEEAKTKIIKFLEGHGFGKPYVDKNGVESKYLYQPRPAGHNVQFDINILQDVLSLDIYEKLFSYHKLDTMAIATFVNDLYIQRTGKDTAPFKKEVDGKMVVSSSLDAVRNGFNLSLKDHHNAFGDVRDTILGYRKMLELVNGKISKGYYAQDFIEEAKKIVGPAHEHSNFKAQAISGTELFDLVCKFVDNGRII